MQYQLSPIAESRLVEIYYYTLKTWDKKQADKYLEGFFICFDDICAERVMWKRIPTRVKIEGYVTKYEKHYVYWRVLTNGHVGIVTILHQRMHQAARLEEDIVLASFE